MRTLLSRLITFCMLAIWFSAAPVAAQDTTSAAPGLRVYLDCSRCDFDYLRREITFVDYVRDRTVAQVHVLVTTERTGSGGRQYTLRFIGRGRFSGTNDELTVSTSQTATDDEERAALAGTLRLGLIRYVAHLPIADRIGISYHPPEGIRPATVRDPWNYWVFRARASTHLSGEELRTSTYLDGSVSANRITDALKIEMSVSGSHDRSSYTLEDSSDFTSTSNSYRAGALVVGSLSPHWSVGAEATARSSTRLNQDLRLRLAPGLEYNWFPYGESTRRRLTALWTVGVEASDYAEPTIFGRTKETRFNQQLEINADVKQPWGSLHGSVEFATYLHDLARNRFDVFGEVDFRLFRGLEFNIFGRYSRVRDQLYLPAGDATTEEILLSLRQLQTGYEYSMSAGLSYTFGSIYNNVVNPRFD